MNLTCPHCGKSLSISHDELVVCHGVVICPQCLTEFVAEGVELPDPEPVTATVAGPVVPEVQSQGGERFCYGCGKELPRHEGLRYCPFCGIALLSNQQAAVASPVAASTPVSQPSVGESRSTVKSDSKPKAASSNAYRYVPKVFSKELRPEPPNLRFKIIAYSIVVVLVAIFGIFVYLGYQL